MVDLYAHNLPNSGKRIRIFKTGQSTDEKITWIKESQVNCLLGNLLDFS